MSHWRTTAAADVFSLSVLSPKCERPRSFPFGGNLCVYLLPSLVSIGKRAYYAPTAETRNCFYTAIRCARFTHALHRRHRPDGRKVENSQVVLPFNVRLLLSLAPSFCQTTARCQNAFDSLLLVHPRLHVSAHASLSREKRDFDGSRERC